MTTEANAAATATTAASDAATAAAPSADTPPPAAADTSTEDAGNKDSGESDPAQGTPTPDADKDKDPNQSSNDKDPEDTDNKDADGDVKEEGNQDAQPAYTDFTMPEGLELDKEAMDEATPILQELNATQEQAQKMVDVAASMLSKAAKKMADQHNAVVEGWRKETLDAFGKDGDAKFQESVGRAEEVVKHFFSEEQRGVLTHYGLGNHPAFFAMCMAIAEGTGEDRPFVSGAGGEQGQKSLAQTWYPKT